MKKLIISIYITLLLVACGGSKSTSPLKEEVISPTPAPEIGKVEEVQLGGIEQSILIHANDLSKPILLVLHGGPGYAMLPLLHENNKALEDSFIVVNWDQRGAGRSYSSNITKASMTLSQFIADAHELTGYLKTRFDRQKIFILGHSFGTVLGIRLIQEYPDDYLAFAGVGQVVNVIENEQLAYDFVLLQANTTNNTIATQELEAVGRPDNEGEYLDDSGYDITAKWVGFFGGDLFGKTSTDEIEEWLLTSSAYINHQNKLRAGWDFSETIFDDAKVWQFDFRTSAASLNVPVFFFTGRHDYDTPFALVEQYFDALSAPNKEIIWFENSAHFPFYEEPEKFNDTLIQKFSIYVE